MTLDRSVPYAYVFVSEIGVSLYLLLYRPRRHAHNTHIYCHTIYQSEINVIHVVESTSSVGVRILSEF